MMVVAVLGALVVGIAVTIGTVKLAVKLERMRLRWLPTPVPFMVLTPIVIVGYLYGAAALLSSL